MSFVPAIPASATASALTFRSIRDSAELEALAPAWEKLLSESRSAEPMLAPAWLFRWQKIYGQDRELRIGLFHEGGRLVGIAPMTRRRFWARPGIPFRRVEPLGVDVAENDGVCSDYLNLIAHVDFEEAVAAAFVRELGQGGFGAWDDFVLPAMDGLSSMPAHLLNYARAAGYSAQLDCVNEAPYIALPKSWDEYLKLHNKKKRQMLQYTLRDFHAWAGTEFSVERVTGVDNLERGKAILQELHQSRWQKSDRAGVFAAERFHRFHDGYMLDLLKSDQLDLCWLVVRGEPVAVQYSIRANEKIYFYQCGRRMDLPSDIRIGVVLLAFAIQDAIGRGLREFDFLAGPAVYKSQLAPESRPLVQVRFVRSAVKERIRTLAERGIEQVRRVRNWWRKQ